MGTRDLEYLKKINHINFEIYHIEREQLRLPINEYKIPFLFLITQEGLVFSVFIPELYEERFSDDYYEHVRNLIINSYIDHF